MSWLATWLTFELIGVGAAPELSEPQAFKNVSLQMMVDKTSTFCHIFYKKLHHNQIFDVRYDWQSGNVSDTLLPLPASAFTKICRFHRFQLHIPGYNITKCCILP